MVETPSTPLGETLGPYRLLQPLGGGGMGQVWLAEHEKLQRRVALKLIRADLLRDPNYRARFEREVRTASRLDHPNICHVYEVGEDRGQPFMAMQWLQGESLEEWIGRAPTDGREQFLALPEPTPADRQGSDGSGRKGATARIVRLVEKLARALHAAHQAGVVHRDVKPNNIMITEAGEPVLVDFGLARDERGTDESITSTSAVPGTPHYFAPEQVQGHKATARTDVWALGVVLYRCLTLHLPFVGATAHSLLQQIVRQEPLRPRRHDPSISRELEIVVLKALAKDPAHRYATAADFAEDLRRVRCIEPILARRMPLPVRALRWMQRNPAPATAMGLLAIGLGVTGTLLLKVQEARAGERRNAAATSFQAGVSATRDGEWQEALARFDLARATGHTDPTAVALARTELFAALDEPQMAAEELARVVEPVPPEHRARWLLLRGELRNGEAGDPQTGLDDVLAALAIIDQPLVAADRLYAEALLATDIAAAAELLLRARRHDPKHILAGRMVLPLLFLLGRQDQTAATATELSRLFPRDPKPWLMHVLAAGFGGRAAAARQLLDQPGLLDDDRAIAELVLDLLDDATTFLDRFSHRITMSIQGGSPPDSLLDVARMGAVLRRLPELAPILEGGRHHSQLRLAPCVRIALAPALRVNVGMLTGMVFGRKEAVEWLLPVTRMMPDPLLAMLAPWEGNAAQGASFWRAEDEKTAQALSGAGPFLAWPPARRCALNWRVVAQNNLWHGRRAADPNVPADLDDRVRATARELLATEGVTTVEARAAVGLTASIGDVAFCELLLANWEQLHPDDPWPAYARGRLAVFAQDWLRAKAMFERALQIQPDYREAKDQLKAAEEKLQPK